MTQITKLAIEAAKAAYWHEAHNGGGYSDKCYEAALTAAIPFLSPIAGDGKVKQLEWSTISFGDEIADSILGTYTITGGETFFVWFAGQADDEDYSVAAPSMEAAKSAAQSDFNTRILSALISSPGKDGGQEVEAVPDRGETCPHCKGEGCQPGDPEGAPLEACDYCNGSGKKISTQPASTALVERLTAHCQTCDDTGKEGRHSICRDCDESVDTQPADEIWIEPYPPADPIRGQDWSETNAWGQQATKYVRADIAETLTKALEQIANVMPSVPNERFRFFALATADAALSTSTEGESRG